MVCIFCSFKTVMPDMAPLSTMVPAMCSQVFVYFLTRGDKIQRFSNGIGGREQKALGLVLLTLTSVLGIPKNCDSQTTELEKMAVLESRIYGIIMLGDLQASHTGWQPERRPRWRLSTKISAKDQDNNYTFVQ